MSVLVISEHDNTELKEATLNVVTAAIALGSDVHVLVAGAGCAAVGEAAAKVAGVAKVLVADDAAYEYGLAEPMADLIKGLAADYSAVLAPATTSAKNIMPRVAALLDVAQISEITEVVSEDTFVRPIYAGNAMATVAGLCEQTVDQRVIAIANLIERERSEMLTKEQVGSQSRLIQEGSRLPLQATLEIMRMARLPFPATLVPHLF